jgi:hypothetical protein
MATKHYHLIVTLPSGKESRSTLTSWEAVRQARSTVRAHMRGLRTRVDVCVSDCEEL